MKFSIKATHIVTEEEANEPEHRNLKVGETAEQNFELDLLEVSESFGLTNVTQADLDKFPELATHGVKLGDSVAFVKLPTKEELSNDDAFEDLMDRYKERYPDNKVFYISSDNQVFLQVNKQDAIIHQKSLDQDKDIQVIEND